MQSCMNQCFKQIGLMSDLLTHLCIYHYIQSLITLYWCNDVINRYWKNPKHKYTDTQTESLVERSLLNYSMRLYIRVKNQRTRINWILVYYRKYIIINYSKYRKNSPIADNFSKKWHHSPLRRLKKSHWKIFSPIDRTVSNKEDN